MSRFLPWSELCALNAAAPSPFPVSPLLFDVVRDALDWARATEGIFDPTVIDVLHDIGYDRTFDLVRDAPRAAREIERRPRRWQSIVLDEDLRTVTLPEGVAFDLSGIGKGYTVDRAIERLGPDANAIVNASGDLRAAGAGPHDTGWRVGVQTPSRPMSTLPYSLSEIAPSRHPAPPDASGTSATRATTTSLTRERSPRPAAISLRSQSSQRRRPKPTCSPRRRSCLGQFRARTCWSASAPKVLPFDGTGAS